MLGTYVGGAQSPRLLVGGEQRPLGVGGEGGGDVGAPAFLGLLLELGPDRLRVCVDSFEHAPHHIVLERRIKEVLARQVEVAPLHGLLGRTLQ